MADTTLTFTAKQLQDTPGSNGLVPQVNGAFAPLLNNTITNFRLLANDRARRDGQRLDALVSYNAPGGTILASPFVLLAVAGRTLQSVAAQIITFQNANPGYWYSDIRFDFIEGITNTIRPYIGFVVYSQDPMAGENWTATAGGGGGGGGGVPIAGAGITTATVADEVFVDDDRAVIWEIALQDANGNVRTLVITAQHNGTAGADASVADYSINGLPATGTVTISPSVDLDGSGGAQTMRLILTPTAGTWEFAGFRRALEVT